MSRLFVLGLSGHMGSGKTTVTNILRDKLAIPVVSIKFASPLYEMQEKIYATIESVHQRLPTFIKDRVLLQWLGTEWGRNTISETLWTDIWIKRVMQIKETLDRDLLVIADDVRFPNEADAIKVFDGMVVQINNHRGLMEGIHNHPSETKLPIHLVDFILDNTGDINLLTKRVIDFSIKTGLPIKQFDK